MLFHHKVHEIFSISWGADIGKSKPFPPSQGSINLLIDHCPPPRHLESILFLDIISLASTRRTPSPYLEMRWGVSEGARSMLHRFKICQKFFFFCYQILFFTSVWRFLTPHSKDFLGNFSQADRR